MVLHHCPGKTFGVLKNATYSNNGYRRTSYPVFFMSGIALKEMCNGFEQFRYKLLSYADDKQNNSTIINFLQLFLREYCYRLSKISFTIQVQNT